MTARTRRVAVLALTLAVVSVGVVFAGVDDADRAFADGDHAVALRLYDEVLAETPDDVHALYRSGLLLSWSRRYDEAIERYDRLLASHPDHREAALERAKVLSWDRRFAAAAAAFEALLAADPDDRDARLGLARTRSWSGRQLAARREYTTLLARDPGDADAAVGIAQTFAWSGDPVRARRWYLEALDRDPDKTGAILGLAYLDLWGPDRASADARIARLEAMAPGDPEVDDLAEARAEAGAWWSAVAWDRTDDTDDNVLDVTRIETGTGIGARGDLVVGLARYDMSDPTGNATHDTAQVVLGWRFRPTHRGTLRLGADRAEGTSGGRTTVGIGGVAWAYTPRSPWRVDLSFDRDPLRYSPTILDAGVVLERARAAVTAWPWVRWRLHGAVERWDGSDGNARDDLTFEIAHTWPLEPVRLETAYVLETAGWDADLDNGYFDPTEFTSHRIRNRLTGPLGRPGGRWELVAEAGVQSFTLGGVEVDGDTVVGASGRLLVPFADRFVLDVHAAWSDYAAQTTSGFESTRFGARLRWRWR